MPDSADGLRTSLPRLRDRGKGLRSQGPATSLDGWIALAIGGQLLAAEALVYVAVGGCQFAGLEFRGLADETAIEGRRSSLYSS